MQLNGLKYIFTIIKCKNKNKTKKMAERKGNRCKRGTRINDQFANQTFRLDEFFFFFNFDSFYYHH